MSLFKLFLTFCLFVGAVDAAKREVTEITEEMQGDTKVITKTIKLSLVNESEENRERKKVSVTASIFGGLYDTQAVGVTTGYFINQDEMISLSYFSLGERGSKTYNYADDGKSFEISYKNFTGNSFYIQPYVFYTEYKESDRTNLSNTSFQLKTSIKGYGAGVKFGNQWQWNRLTLGCDWIGYGRFLSYDDYIREDTFISAIETSHITVLNFYLGVAF